VFPLSSFGFWKEGAWASRDQFLIVAECETVRDAIMNANRNRTITSRARSPAVNESFQRLNQEMLRFSFKSILMDTMPISLKARLTQPLVRVNGSHRPASWDQAMDRVVAAFRKSIEKNDPQNFGMFSCSKTTNELNYAAQKFVRSAMGTNNIDSCNRT